MSALLCKTLPSGDVFLQTFGDTADVDYWTTDPKEAYVFDSLHHASEWARRLDVNEATVVQLDDDGVGVFTWNTWGMT